MEHQFAALLNGNICSYLQSLTPSQGSHGMARDFLLECNTNTEVCVGQSKAAKGQLVMWRVTVHRDHHVERSVAKRALTHLGASCSGKGLAKHNERDIGWEVQLS